MATSKTWLFCHSIQFMTRQHRLGRINDVPLYRFLGLANAALGELFFFFFFTAPRRSMSSSFAPDPYGRTAVLQARQSKKWHRCIGRTPLAASDGSPYYYPSGKQILPPTSLDCVRTSAMRRVSCCVERPMMIEDREQEPLLGSLRKLF